MWGGGEQKTNREGQTAARKSGGGILHSAAPSALLLCTVHCTGACTLLSPDIRQSGDVAVSDRVKGISFARSTHSTVG